MADLRRWCLALSLIALSMLAYGCGPATFVVGITPGDQELTETVVVHDTGRRHKIAIVDVSGMISNGRQNGLLQQGMSPVADLHEKLARAAYDSRVKAVVLRVNSPGGTVMASEAMHDEVQRFRVKTGKPVVVCMMDVAASGGYYLSCGADRIVAYPSTITGSIGVIMQTVSVKPALERLGVEATTIRSGPIKGAGSLLDSLTPEQQEVFQGMVDSFYERFVDAVANGRENLSRDRVLELADGRVYTGIQALEVGLVDALGDIYTAYHDAKTLAKVEHADLVLYHRPLDYVAAPYSRDQTPQLDTGGTTINLFSLNVADGMVPGAPVTFSYLWTVE